MVGLSAFSRRFAELVTKIEAVEATKREKQSEYGSGDYIDSDAYLNWRVSARSLLATACGRDSEHYRQFVESEKPSLYQTNYEQLRNLKAVFNAASEDYEGGYFSSVRNIIQAEVFDSELEQATSLLSSGYKVPAAVIAGVVLETTLRQLCADAGLEMGKLDKMNSDLAKVGKYNSLMQKKITALAAIRNSAAHGNSDQFSDADVKGMIADVENFLSQHL